MNLLGNITGQFKINCKHCKKPVSGSYAATSNFHTHMKVRLRKIHLKNFWLYNVYPNLSFSKRHHPEIHIEHSSTTNSTLSRQGPIANFVAVSGTPVLWKATDPNQIEMTNYLVKYICNSLKPLCEVENPDFCALMKKAQPAYKIPSRKYLSTKILPAKTSKLHINICK